MTLPTYIDALRAAGAVGLGVAAGMTISISTIAQPSARETLPTQHRLVYWSRIYDHGKVQVPTLVIGSTIPLALAAYFARPLPHIGVVGAHRREILGLSAGIAFAIIPYTFAVMIPGIKRLKTIEQKVKLTGEVGAATVEVEQGILKWDYQHGVRSILLLTAFVLSVAELVAC